ncbi:hypothetical protein HYN48_14920 [Flavobacterium magnum]|uniref:DUF4199 domain-containing protein n=1 Tax=Flavobacterium magnum TaxID=2162713 RepID=A0A2S0RJG4_9FLAO|nr:DUF4199 family protein [Flavobacterium magnum]AWA31281.1 hypothetical protein HYN48_14920 [Flavobacterium magnum]
MTSIVKKTGLQSGIALGTLLILLSAYIYFQDLGWFNNVVVGMLTLLGIVISGTAAAILVRRKLGGFITFREAFATYFLTIFTAHAMQCVFAVIITSFVLTTETKVSMKQQMYEFNLNLMKQNLAPEADKDKMTASWPAYDPFSVKEVITPSILYLLRDCLFGFLAALVIRNKRALL